MAPTTGPTSNYDAKTCEQLRAILAKRKVFHKRLKFKAQLVAAALESKTPELMAELKAHEEELEAKRKAREEMLKAKRKADEELRQERIKRLKVEEAKLVAQLQERGLNSKKKTLIELRQILKEDDKRLSRDNLWRSLFQRDFKADATRKSFQDLPGELRDICYRYVFQDVTNNGRHWDIRYRPVLDRFEAFRHRDFSRFTFRLLKLSTLNKPTRREVRAIFWSLLNFELRPKVDTRGRWSIFAPTYIAVLERFLRGLGDEGRLGVRMLGMNESSCYDSCLLVPQDFTPNGYSAFMRVCNMLSGCSSLTKIKFSLPEQYLFHGEQAALEDILLHGKALNSQGVHNFQKILQSLPRLRSPRINALTINIDERHIKSKEVTPFLRYAFTGRRRYFLLAMIKIVLEQTQLQVDGGQVTVEIPGNICSGHRAILNYEEWLRVCDGE